MKCIIFSGHGGPEVITIAERPIPEPQEGELLVKVHAAGINKPDILQRQGNYAPPPSVTDIPGLEIAGKVVDCKNTTMFRKGDLVCGLVPGGGYAEYAVVHETNALPFPVGLNAIESASLPETYFTVWTNLFDRAGLKDKDNVLIHGGSGGIGTTAVQLAKSFGATVFATVGNNIKASACKSLGADVCINYHSDDFVDVINKATNNKGVDIILDMLGGDYIRRDLDCLAVEGKIVVIARIKGDTATIPLLKIMVKRQTITASTLRPRSILEKAAIAKSLQDKVWPKFKNKQIKPVVFKTFPLEHVKEAHICMEAGQHIGKIVITMPDYTTV